MPDEYGLTLQGPNIKRLDVILGEMHDDLTRGWGVNTRQDPQSLLNHLLTNVADRIAELWEFGEQVYYSQYPSTAEGTSLDLAAQLGGSTRGMEAKSYYRILCTGIDGTDIPAGTMLSSNTNPTTALILPVAGRITRSNFNQAIIIYAEQNTKTPLGLALDGTLFTVNPEHGGDTDLQALADAVKDKSFEFTVSEGQLTVRTKDPICNHTMVLSENLTTETVGSVLTFGTVESGDIYLPPGTVVNITKGPADLQSVTNVGEYVPGNLTETDREFRVSYIDKIFNRSANMLESIRSAILANVPGVVSCALYENDGNVVDEMGRYPHSVEAVVEGGDTTEIAQQILRSKAGGISTYGNQEVVLPGAYGEPITIRFNRPIKVYIWYHVEVILSRSVFPATNYADLVKEQIMRHMEGLKAGDSVTPQKFQMNVSGIDFMDIWLYSTKDEGTSPRTKEEYKERVVLTTPRERAITDETRIEVVLQDG